MGLRQWDFIKTVDLAARAEVEGIMEGGGGEGKGEVRSTRKEGWVKRKNLAKPNQSRPEKSLSSISFAGSLTSQASIFSNFSHSFPLNSNRRVCMSFLHG